MARHRALNTSLVCKSKFSAPPLAEDFPSGTVPAPTVERCAQELSLAKPARKRRLRSAQTGNHGSCSEPRPIRVRRSGLAQPIFGIEYNNRLPHPVRFSQGGHDAADGTGFDFDDAIQSEHRIRPCRNCKYGVPTCNDGATSKEGPPASGWGHGAGRGRGRQKAGSSPVLQTDSE
jgi:hypothetical protein